MLRGVLFDLDGVLIDSLASIGACFNYALQRVGRPPPSLSALREAIGPPLEESAARLLATDDAARIAEFVAIYRERYAATAVEETRPVDGLDEVLAALAARWPLAVATSKAEVFVRPILAALGVDHYFGEDRGARRIFGRSLALDAEPKAAVIARALAAFDGRADGLVMVGDRHHDVRGAAVHGIPTIGVLHGMGSRAELEAAGARWIAADLRGVPPLLRQIAAEWS